MFVSTPFHEDRDSILFPIIFQIQYMAHSKPSHLMLLISRKHRHRSNISTNPWLSTLLHVMKPKFWSFEDILQRIRDGFTSLHFASEKSSIYFDA